MHPVRDRGHGREMVYTIFMIDTFLFTSSLAVFAMIATCL